MGAPLPCLKGTPILSGVPLSYPGVPPGRDMGPQTGVPLQKGPGTRDQGTPSPVDGQTPVKTLPSLVLCTRVVTIDAVIHLA